MARKSPLVPVKPEILVWARETIGMSLADVSKKLRVSVDSVHEWESGHKSPKLSTLEKLANIYKRPLAVFFLPETPKEPPLPRDFRSLSTDGKAVLSPKTRLAIRNARWLQSSAIELARQINQEAVPKITKLHSSEDPETLAGETRRQLGVAIETQFNWKDETQAFDKWRKAIEGLGILVFQTSMPVEEIRAFSLAEKEMPVIVVNSKDVITARNFSLFHEYAHLGLGTGGICNMEEPMGLPTMRQQGTEQFCNYFAGSVLVPKESLLKYMLDIPPGWFDNAPDETLRKIARAFKVSQEVVLRRMVICGLVGKDIYQTKKEEWKAKERIRGKTGYGMDPTERCIREKGTPFVQLTFEAYRQGQITYKDVADYLSVKTKYIPEVQRSIRSSLS